jgi:hypothetical protein
MEAKCSSKTSINQTTRRYITEDRTLHPRISHDNDDFEIVMTYIVVTVLLRMAFATEKNTIGLTRVLSVFSLLPVFWKK